MNLKNFIDNSFWSILVFYFTYKDISITFCHKTERYIFKYNNMLPILILFKYFSGMFRLNIAEYLSCILKMVLLKFNLLLLLVYKQLPLSAYIFQVICVIMLVNHRINQNLCH